MKIKDLEEGFGQFRGGRDAYPRDYDSSVTGFGRPRREIDDESNLMYIYNAERERLQQKMIDNRDERSAHQEGYRDSKEGALKVHGIIRSKFDPKKWVQKQGTQWVQVYPFGKPDELTEFASAPGNMTTAANVNVGAVYKNKPPKQPKNKDGTAKNALDMDANLMTGGSIKR
jgi:hypothetical protein